MAGPFGSVGTDYREMQAPEQVNTDLPNNDAALRAEELGGLFKEFEGVSSDVYNRTQTTAGALAGAASGATGSPQYRQGLQRLTAYGQAFNNAATGAYAVEAEAQADDAAARLRVQANNNPAAFHTTFTAVRDSVLKNAPADAVPMLTELYNRHLAEGLAAISGDQAAEQKQLQAQTYEYGIQRQTSRVAILQGSANPQDQLRAQDEQVKLSLLIDGGANSGLYSKAEAQAMHVNAMRAITEQVFETQVDRELADPNGDVMGLLDRFRKAHIDNISNPKEAPILSEPEFQSLMQNATTKIREYRLTQELMAHNGKTAQELRYEAGDVKYTAAVLRGRASEQELSDAVTTGDLKPETARSLRSLILNLNQQPKSSGSALLRLYTDPNFLDMTDVQIASYPGINAVDALKAIDERNKRNASWEGTQQVKDAKAAISAALKVNASDPAAMLDPAKRNAVANAELEFIARMNKVDPAARGNSAMSVAQDVITGIKQQQTQQDINNLQLSKQSLMQRHGPHSSDPWSSDKLQQAMQMKDQQITSLQRQLSGK